jgi:hypothetical protein
MARKIQRLKGEVEIMAADGQWFFPGEVLLDGRRIVVDYVVDADHVVYEGTRCGDGHWSLTCADPQGHAVLHRLPAGGPLVGTWEEQGEGDGFWRIVLET